MNTFLRTAAFDVWLSALKDGIGKARIAQRIRAAELGHFGGTKPVGEGVSEMRIHIGPGYRVYYMRIGGVVYLLLAGGSKASQRRDIKQVLDMARALKEQLP